MFWRPVLWEVDSCSCSGLIHGLGKSFNYPGLVSTSVNEGTGILSCHALGNYIQDKCQPGGVLAGAGDQARGKDTWGTALLGSIKQRPSAFAILVKQVSDFTFSLMFILICTGHDEFGVSMFTYKNETRTTEIVQIGEAWTLVLVSWCQVPTTTGCLGHAHWGCRRSDPGFAPSCGNGPCRAASGLRV